MQIANVMVALGGDRGSTVPKYGVTASEIQVLRAIHGEEAVFDVEPVGEIERSDREEIARLADPVDGYGLARNENGQRIVETLFPGGPLARAFRNINDIGLDESFFKPLTRATAPAAAAKPAKRNKKADPEPEPEDQGGLFAED